MGVVKDINCHKILVYGHNIMNTSHTTRSLPIPVNRALSKLGRDISAARRRRRITMEVLAARAGINRKTLAKIEKGDPGVLMAHYASVLFALGLVERLGDTGDIAYDEVGRDLEEEMLPKRIRKARRKPMSEHG